MFLVVFTTFCMSVTAASRDLSTGVLSNTVSLQENSSLDSIAVYVETIARQIPVGISSGMKYSQYSKFYRAKDYTPSLFDRYSPGGAGAASFFVPGLGHAICGEWGRAALYFLTSCIGSCCWGYTLGVTVGYGGGEGWLVLSTACLLAIDIMAIVDSVQVAKIKNMYEQDVRRLSSVDFKVNPYIAMDPHLNYATGSNIPLVGLTLSLKF